MSTFTEEIQKRRTFAIISHPDAGKTTLTEKLLLFGGAIHVAGAVKSNKIKKTATSDWMEIEKQRGISVATSVMGFNYGDYKINILDTPGHQDFAEDTYRTLTAVDSVIIVIDVAKGVKTQTRKLMEVCRMRKTPVIVFVNKLDREGQDPFDLLDEIESELKIAVRPLSWPINIGQRFKGVYNIYEKNLNLYTPSKQVVTEAIEFRDIDSPELEKHIGESDATKLRADLELISGVYPDFDVEKYLSGDLAPVFFGSALNNFGVRELLDCFVEIAPSPRPVQAIEREVRPEEEAFSGFVFKIQANMNKAHHDRIAFMRVCSGKFDATKDVYHVQSGKKMRLSRPQQIMAQDRKVIDEAYAGDVMGVFDPGIFSIGDTICSPGRKFAYEGIPTFAPEHFCRLVALDSMKRKQFMKGVTQIAQEGAIQIFQDYNLEMSEIIVGVVGVLQFDVLKYRMENEYGCDVRLDSLPYNYIRWVKDQSTDLNSLKCPSDTKKVKDMKGNPLILFTNEWSIKMALDRNEGLEFMEFSKN